MNKKKRKPLTTGQKILWTLIAILFVFVVFALGIYFGIRIGVIATANMFQQAIEDLQLVPLNDTCVCTTSELI